MRNFFKRLFSRSPYCRLCNSCGEGGCCSPIKCMYKCMVTERPKKCDYGEYYANEITFSYNLSLKYEDEIQKFRDDKKLTKKEFLKNIDIIWNETYDSVYTKK